MNNRRRPSRPWFQERYWVILIGVGRALRHRCVNCYARSTPSGAIVMAAMMIPAGWSRNDPRWWISWFSCNVNSRMLWPPAERSCTKTMVNLRTTTFIRLHFLTRQQQQQPGNIVQSIIERYLCRNLLAKKFHRLATSETLNQLPLDPQNSFDETSSRC